MSESAFSHTYWNAGSILICLNCQELCHNIRASSLRQVYQIISEFTKVKLLTHLQ